MRYLLAWFFLCGCSVATEGYRVWVGPNRVVDWIDVGFLADRDPMTGSIDIVYADYSPIEWVRQQPGYGCSFVIKKKFSAWVLESMDGLPETYSLRAMRVER